MKSILLVAALLVSGSAVAEEHATKAEAEAMVKKAVAALKAGPREPTYAEINNKQGKFTDRDLYITVYGLDGVVRAHGSNPKMIGKNLMDLKDIDGKPFVKERIEMAKKQPSFWQEYKFTNPTTSKIEPKAMYCQALDDLVVCGGVYNK